jgi:c-di-GMP-binding flagellar brake protein YcgR
VFLGFAFSWNISRTAAAMKIARELSDMAKEVADNRAEGSSYELGKLGKPFFLPVGIPLQIEIEGVSFRMKSVSVGWLPDTCLIIKRPSTPMSITRMLFKGNKVTVRYIDAGSAFGFESELIAVADEPLGILYISYPVHIVRKSLRSSRRIECHLPAQVFRREPETGEETPLGEGVIVDISRMGCGFTVPGESHDEALAGVRIGDTVVLGFPLPGTENDIALGGKVRRIERDLERTTAGIQFLEIEENLKEKIMSYISALEKFNWETY